MTKKSALDHRPSAEKRADAGRGTSFACHCGVACGIAQQPSEDCMFEDLGRGGCRIPSDHGFASDDRDKTKWVCPYWAPISRTMAEGGAG